MSRTAVEQTFLLPDLGEGLTEAEVVRWMVTEGDVIGVDQLIVEVETAKSVVEVPSPYAGAVLKLHAAEGESLEVGKPLITVGGSGPGGPAPSATTEAVQPAAERYLEEEKAGSGNVLIGYGTSEHSTAGRRRRPRKAKPATEGSFQRVLAASPVSTAQALVVSPIVRRLAHEHRIDLGAVRATGPGDVITRADVEQAIAGGPSASPSAEASLAPPIVAVSGERRIPLNGFRRAVAAVLSRSRAEIPEATVWVDVDVTALWELRASNRTASDPGPGLMAYIARFVVAGLKRHPVLNARLDTERDEIVEYDEISLGIAVQGDRGLVVPAVSNAGTLTTHELDEKIREATERARIGKVTAEELAAGTFTLNNYGSFRVDGSAAIINHPQVAILGFGRIIDRPWVVEGQIVPRKIAQMSFVFDHRVCDGATAASFMRFVADAIENPVSAIARM